ncbi:unnamed protein product [Adineta steineri]|uniref:N-terminal Ras-GEF domain-containing protein n=1 Tax=Adineta steineri TaxID=433720 RepID=A0A820EKM5_9BILA|nr:unnamed protein product [Adineta steineri]
MNNHEKRMVLSILQRELYNILVTEDAQQILLTPDPTQYKFCAPNLPTNIQIDYHTNDKSSSSPSFTIRGATIEKLIEHLTHHQLLHPRFVKSFLMTYKSYCTPLEIFIRTVINFQKKYSQEKHRDLQFDLVHY